VDENEVFRGYGGFGALGHSVYHRELFPRLVKDSSEGIIKHIVTSGTLMYTNFCPYLRLDLGI